MDYLRLIAVLGLTLWCCPLCVRGQTDKPLEYNLEEENPGNTYVGNITKDAKLYETRTREQLAQIRYTFTSGPGIHRQYFSINSQTGILSTLRSVDREEVCDSDSECKFDMAVMIQPYEFFQIIKIAVNIIDINDHYPRFPTNKNIMTISEATATGSVFTIPVAEDLDSGVLGVQQYRLDTESEEFDLRVTDSADGSKDVQLVLTGSLDKEQLDWYDLLITAVDGGTPPKTGSMLLEITVLDANDNNPRFDNDMYHATLSENTPTESTVVKVHATDLDSGPNGEIVYSFASATEQDFGHMFNLNSQTGDILVSGLIDYEEVSDIQLSVLAHDRGADSLPAHTKVIIKVTDINDHAPEISINTLTDTERAEVREASVVGTFVAHISVTDQDSGLSGDVSCSISDEFFTLEQLYGSEYTLKTARVFDRELRSEYQVEVECSDFGENSLTTIEPIVVYILDLNDHDPVFWDMPYSANIRENNVVGMYLLQVNATDKDSGRNSAVKFKVMKSAEEETDMIAIHPVSGVMTANTVFDYEKDQILEFIIIGYDQGDRPRSATALFTLTVEDTNDELPQFYHDIYEFSVYENQPAGTEAGVVVAIDQDSPPYNEITYSLEGDHSYTSAFIIDSQTGEISTTEVLDREINSIYELRVSADNLGYPNLKTFTNLTILIVDQNDNAPVILFPSLDNNTVELSSKVELGTVVTSVLAHDPDDDQNSLLSYRFEAENDTFALNETSGEIILTKELSDDPDQMYRFDIMVLDHGSPQKHAKIGLLLFVNRQRVEQASAQMSVIDFLKGHLFIIIIGTVAFLLLIFMILMAVVCMARRHSGRDSKGVLKKADMVAADSTEKIPMDSMNRSPTHSGGPPGPPRNGTIPEKRSVSPVEVEPCNRKGVTFQMDNTESYTEEPPPPWSDRLDATVIENPRAHCGSPSGGSDNEVDIVKYPRPHPDKLALGSHAGRWGRGQSVEGMYSHPDAPRLQLHAPPPRPPPRSSPITPLTEMELEVHEMLRILQQDRDSETGSITDSGRGGSEEGEHMRQSPMGPGPDELRGDRRISDFNYPRGILKHDRARRLASRPVHLHPTHHLEGGLDPRVHHKKCYPSTDGMYSPSRVGQPKPWAGSPDKHVLPSGGSDQPYLEPAPGEESADFYDKPYHFNPGKGWNSPHGYNTDNYYDPRERRIFHEGCGDALAKPPKDTKYYSYSPPKGSNSPSDIKLPPRYPSDSIHECASPELKAKYAKYGQMPYPSHQKKQNDTPSCTCPANISDVSSFKPQRNLHQRQRQNRSDIEKIAEREGGKVVDTRLYNKMGGSKDETCESGISDTSDTFSLESGQYYTGEQLMV